MPFGCKQKKKQIKREKAQRKKPFGTLKKKDYSESMIALSVALGRIAAFAFAIFGW